MACTDDTEHTRITELSGWGAARAEDAQGAPTQSHISPSILVYEEKNFQVVQLFRGPSLLYTTLPHSTISREEYGAYIRCRANMEQKSTVERIWHI